MSEQSVHPVELSFPGKGLILPIDHFTSLAHIMLQYYVSVLLFRSGLVTFIRHFVCLSVILSSKNFKWGSVIILLKIMALVGPWPISTSVELVSLLDSSWYFSNSTVQKWFKLWFLGRNWNSWSWEWPIPQETVNLSSSEEDDGKAHLCFIPYSKLCFLLVFWKIGVISSEISIYK